MKDQVTKISTIYKRERANSPTIFESIRDEFLEVIVNSRPKFDPKIIISRKPF